MEEKVSSTRWPSCLWGCGIWGAKQEGARRKKKEEPLEGRLKEKVFSISPLFSFFFLLSFFSFFLFLFLEY